MPQLSDTQSILLATAAQREDGSLYPLPATITAPAGGVAKSIGALVKRGLAEERAVGNAAQVYRSDGDQRFGLFVTTAGKAAIGIDEDAPVGPVASPSPAPSSVAPGPARQTKAALVLALLGRAEGATLAELVEATDWLPHTTRAALTGLRKKGHAIERSKRTDATCYRVAA